MAKILVIDDTPDILNLISNCLHTEKEYDIFTAENGETGIAMFEKIVPDLVVLDLTLPDISGWDILRVIRQDRTKRYTPVLIITATCKTPIDEVHALKDFKADDYIVKPFNIDIFLARVKTLLRRTQWLRNEEKKQKTLPDILISDNLKIIVSQRLVTYKKQPIKLTKMEFKLLCYFMSNKNRIVTIEELLKSVWNIFCADYTTHTVVRHIKTLREKLGSARKKIATLHSDGYKFLD